MIISFHNWDTVMRYKPINSAVLIYISVSHPQQNQDFILHNIVLQSSFCSLRYGLTTIPNYLHCQTR